MKYIPFVLLIVAAFGCGRSKIEEKRIADSLARADSIAIVDSTLLAQGEIMRAMENDEVIGPVPLEVVIFEGEVVVSTDGEEIMTFSFPQGQEYQPEEEGTIIGYMDATSHFATYTFKTALGECPPDLIDGIDTTYTKTFADNEFTVTTGGVGGRDETDYYLYQHNYKNICFSFIIEARESWGPADYDAMIRYFEEFLGTLEFK